MGSVSWPYLPLPRVEGEQQRPETRVGWRQAGWPRLWPQSASRLPLQPPTAEAPPAAPETALLNPLPSTPEASKRGLSRPIPGALSVFTAPIASRPGLITGTRSPSWQRWAGTWREGLRARARRTAGQTLQLQGRPTELWQETRDGPRGDLALGPQEPTAEEIPGRRGPRRCPAPYAASSRPDTSSCLLLCCTNPNRSDAPKLCSP